MRGSASEVELEEFHREVKLLSALKHPNILSLCGITVTSDEDGVELGLVMELMASDLRRLLNESLIIPIKWKVQIGLDVAQGCSYLHSCIPPILHRDIKPENILLAADGTAKVCDFGASTFKPVVGKRALTRNVGTFGYMAPEVTTSDQYTEHCDVYSFGVVFCELMNHHGPGSLDIDRRTIKPAKGVPATIRHVIVEAMSADPALRPRFEEIHRRLDRVYPSIAEQDVHEQFSDSDSE